MAFHGPLSTTISKLEANIFSTATGMVLEMTSLHPRLDQCCAFDVSLVSDYPNENEYLIGFVYLRVLNVQTRSLVEDVTNEDQWRAQPMASKIRSVFFAVHLFRQQVFSMSAHLEYYLVQFLKCHNMECCDIEDDAETGDVYDDEKQSTPMSAQRPLSPIYRRPKDSVRNINESPLKTDDGANLPHLKEHRKSFLSWLCCHVADVKHHRPITSKKEWESMQDANQWKEGQWKRVMRILWNKFNEFRKNPNGAQLIKIDQISDGLKEQFLQKKEEDDDGNIRYTVDLGKIRRIFPNVEEIQYFNQYKFDNDVLKQLVDILEDLDREYQHHGVCEPLKFRKLRFLYYDYPEENEMPVEGDYFCDPKQLDKDLVSRLERCKWEIKTDTLKHEDTGKSFGFRIAISQPNESFAEWNENEANEDSVKQEDDAKDQDNVAEDDVAEDTETMESESVKIKKWSPPNKEKSEWSNNDCMEWIGSLDPKFQKYKSAFIEKELDFREILSLANEWNKM